MKDSLQNYETQTRYLLIASGALLAVGIYLYLMDAHFGGLFASLGAVGLVWCFLRR